MDIMKEKGKVTRESKHQVEQKELRGWYETGNSSRMMISDESGKRICLGINRRQESKKFLIAVIESRPESVLGPMPELVEIVL